MYQVGLCEFGAERHVRLLQEALEVGNLHSFPIQVQYASIDSMLEFKVIFLTILPPFRSNIRI